MPAAVLEHQVRMQDGRPPGGAGAQAQLHVLGEQVRGRVERPELAQHAGPRGQAGGDRPAHGAGPRGAVGLEPVAQRVGQRRRMHQRTGERADGARQRVGGALHAAVGVEQPGDVQRARVVGGGTGEPGQRVVEQLAIGIEQHGHVVARALDAGVGRRAEARVGPQLDHLGAPGGGALGAAVGRAGVDRDQLRPRRQVRVDRAQQRRQLGGGVVQHDDDREGHGAGP